MADTATEYAEVFAAAKAAGQEHIFRWWDDLDERGRRKLLYQARSIDFDLVSELIAKYLHAIPKPFSGTLEPPEVIPVPSKPEQHAERRRMEQLGAEIISSGQVCLFIVAGGQGTRLKYDPPKGTFPICPISRKSLFQVFAEKLLAASRRYGVTIPLYIMTSAINNNATQEFFRINKFFGLGRRNVFFVVQEMLPSVDFNGKVLLKNKDEIATNPNGHGGAIKALSDGGALDDMRQRGIKYISYQQVDNVLVKSIDPVFIGYHAAAGAEMSLKVLRKRNAEEKLGVVGRIDAVKTDPATPPARPGDHDLEASVAVEIGGGQGGGQGRGLERVAGIDRPPTLLAPTEQAIRLARVGDQDLFETVVVEIGHQERRGERGSGQGGWRPLV